MDPVELQLFNTFLKESRKSRCSFLEKLENKYVKTQNESDVIDIRTLAVVKKPGGSSRKLDSSAFKPFGFLTSYCCKKGRKAIRGLKRQIKLRKRARIVQYDNGDTDLSVHDSITVIDLEDSDSTLCSSSFNDKTPERKSVTFAGKEVVNKTFKPSLDNLYVSNTSNYFKGQTNLRKTINILYKRQLPYDLSKIPICDLSLSRIDSKYLGSLQSSGSPQQRHIKVLKQPRRIIKEFYFELEKEVEVIDEYNSKELLTKQNRSVSRSSEYVPFCPHNSMKTPNSVALPLSGKGNSSIPYEQISYNFPCAPSKIRTLPCPITPKFSLKKFNI